MRHSDYFEVQLLDCRLATVGLELKAKQRSRVIELLFDCATFGKIEQESLKSAFESSIHLKNCANIRAAFDAYRCFSNDCIVKNRYLPKSLIRQDLLNELRIEGVEDTYQLAEFF